MTLVRGPLRMEREKLNIMRLSTGTGVRGLSVENSKFEIFCRAMENLCMKIGRLGLL